MIHNLRQIDPTAVARYIKNNPSVYVPILVLVVVFLLTFLIRPKTPLEVFDNLEAEAGKYGVIVAGAPRVAPYDGQLAGDLRDRFLSLVNQLLLENSEEFFQSFNVDWRSADLSVALDAMMAKSAADSTKVRKKQHALDLLESLVKEISAEDLAASRIDRARLRLAHMRYLISQIEDLTLEGSHPLPKGFRRVYLTLELSAFVRPEQAGGAIVYFDLYPKGGDRWAHRVGKILRDAIPDLDSSDPDHKQRRNQILARLNRPYGEEGTEWDIQREKLKKAAFRDWADLDDELPLREEILDPYATAHRYLQKWMPQVVHVDPLDEGELVLDVRGGTTRKSLTASASTASGGTNVGGSVSGSSEKAKSMSSADVNTLSLAFAAGKSRAGWIFLPSTSSLRENAMKPTERRIRIVVDIPKELKRISVHVHKQFLDRKLRPIRETGFGRQLEAVNKARIVLSEVEDWFPYYAYQGSADNAGVQNFRSGTNWTLLKSRMRNTIVQTWSESISVTIPEEPPTSWPTPRIGTPRPIAIRAHIVRDGGAEEGWVLINNDSIQKVDCPENKIPDSAIRLVYDGFLYPGLVDAHNHPHYAAIPRWIADSDTFTNRYEWQRDPRYIKNVKDPYSELKNAGKRYLSLKVGEIRAVMGGATSIQGTFSPMEAGVLIRNLNEDQGIWAYTDSISGLSDHIAAQQIERIKTGEIKRLVFHIAEGTDKRSQQEFEILKKKNLLTDQTTIIHGIALTETQLKEIKDIDASLVWSPVSNYALYDSTLNIKAAIKMGINVALAPDWTVTGSDNILAELKEAWEYIQKRNLEMLIYPKLLFKMVTSNAAEAMGCDDLGQIEAGYRADMFLAPAYTEDPFDNLLRLEPGDIDLVLVEGHAVYGNRYLVTKVGVDDTACDRINDVKPWKVVVVSGDRRYVPKAEETYGVIIKELGILLGEGSVADLIETPVKQGNNKQ
jgi:cytosine/adenosine deaminase-related metal-dependent hydrolase